MIYAKILCLLLLASSGIYASKDNNYDEAVTLAPNSPSDVAKDRTLTCIIYYARCQALCATVNYSSANACAITYSFFFFTFQVKCVCTLYGTSTTTTTTAAG